MTIWELVIFWGILAVFVAALLIAAGFIYCVVIEVVSFFEKVCKCMDKYLGENKDEHS